MPLISGFILPCGQNIYRALLTLTCNIYDIISSLLTSLLSSGDSNTKPHASESAETKHPVKAFGWAAQDTTGVLAPFKFSRRATRKRDVQFKVLYCGICHTDLHQLKNDLGISIYPMVPGHEIVGVVTEIGSRVRKVKVGDKVGVRCMVGSCRKCDQCVSSLENYCPQMIFTYSSIDTDGSVTHGGYSNIMVADERFIVRWPENIPLDRGAPLLCAGATTYSALRYYELDKPGLRIGVVGMGGLGHVAVKFAKAFGVKVTVISTSVGKKKDALETIGADEFLVSRDPEEMKAAAATLDGIIDTVSAVHPVQPLMRLLKVNGKMVLVGLPDKPIEVAAFPMASGRKTVAGSMIGGMKETQEMIDFAAEHNIVAEVEVIPMGYVNEAMERLARGDVKYRFVIDVHNIIKQE